MDAQKGDELYVGNFIITAASEAYFMIYI